MSPIALTAVPGEEELRLLRSANRVAIASAFVALLVAVALVAAWQRAGGAPALIFAGAIGSAGLAGTVILYAARLREAESLYRMIVETSQEGITRKAAEAARREEDVRHALEQALASAGAGTGLATAETGELATRLAEVNEELRTFTYSVSHDLRAPLRTIDGFARELQLDPDTRLSAHGLKSVERIRAASSRMTALIDGLRDLSRASRTALKRETVDLSAMACIAAAELAELDAARAITFEIADGLRASGDPNLLRLVLDNLLGNAVKFTSRNATAHVTFGLCDDGATFFVRDDGAGFDERYAGNLFTPFLRLHPSGEFEGSGIGLATVRRIVLRHGGRVRAEGSPGRGATFFFTLGNGSGDRP